MRWHTSAMLLKISSDYIPKLLTYICNFSLQKVIFPDEHEISNVIPLYDSDDVIMLNHYRPVSVPCFFI